MLRMVSRRPRAHLRLRAGSGGRAPGAAGGGVLFRPGHLGPERHRDLFAGRREVTRDGHDHCSVTGYMTPQTRFELLLPTATWTGGYPQQGPCGQPADGSPSTVVALDRGG